MTPRASLNMSKPEEPESEETRTVSPPHIKRERSEDKESIRRVAQRTETTQEEVEENAKAMMIKMVLEDLRSNDERTLEQALEQIARYLYHEDNEKVIEKGQAFVQVGGYLAVVWVMKEHPSCKILQINGLWVLNNTTYENALANTAVASVEGIQAILAAMKRFPSDPSIMEFGFAALANIVHENEANANLLVTKLGGIPFLIEQMKNFQTDADVTNDTSDFIRNVSFFEHLRKPIVDAKAITVLASIYDHYKHMPDIRKRSCEAMRKLLQDSY